MTVILNLTDLDEADAAELLRSLPDFSGFVRRAWRAVYPQTEDFWTWVVDIFVEHPELGTGVVVEAVNLFFVPMTIGAEDVITFAAQEDWKPIVKTYSFLSSEADAEEASASDDIESSADGDSERLEDESSEERNAQELREISVGHALSLQEQEEERPLSLEVAIIQPGWGNERDNNYYSESMLRECAHIFAGVKMYATDHVPSEKSVRTEVSQILECPIGFTESGAPIARVGIFDGAFKENILARDAHGVLSDLHCSILATGKAKPGFELGGREGNEVVEITAAAAVDWVTKAGAGGHALGIAELDTEVLMCDNEQDAEEVEELQEEEVMIEEAQQEEEEIAEEEELHVLESSEVSAMIEERAKLPEAAIQRLVAAEYANAEAVEAAIQAEVDYVKAITGTGNPPVMQREAPGEISEVDVNERKNAANSRYLGTFGGKK